MMVDVLADPTLYQFTGDEPPTLTELEARYAAQVAGPSNPGELWVNWIVRWPPSGAATARVGSAAAAIGFVQATITVAPDGSRGAHVAWLIGTRWQGRGCASEAAAAMCRWLRGVGIQWLVAHIHPDHSASAGVARACGLEPTGTTDGDGELVWSWVATNR